jgi:ribonuclease BN (tRNA processing enzyme)
VEVTILGSQGTWPGPGGQTCGYLVSHDGFHLWVDAGTGTFARLQEHVDLADIGGMMISHGHPDHFVDMIPAFYARHYGKMGEAGLPFWSPDGFTDLAALLVSENGRNVMAESYDFRVAEEGSPFEIGPFVVTPFVMTHVGVKALGYRIEAGGVALAYTGDTGPCDEVIELARNADVFLAEATYQDTSNLMPFHLSARQAGEIAQQADVRRLVLTHLTPDLDPVVSLREAAEAFDGVVDLAITAMVLEVGT